MIQSHGSTLRLKLESALYMCVARQHTREFTTRLAGMIGLIVLTSVTLFLLHESFDLETKMLGKPHQKPCPTNQSQDLRLTIGCFPCEQVRAHKQSFVVNYTPLWMLLRKRLICFTYPSVDLIMVHIEDVPKVSCQNLLWDTVAIGCGCSAWGSRVNEDAKAARPDTRFHPGSDLQQHL